MDNEVMELIDQLYTMVSEAWGVPLGNDRHTGRDSVNSARSMQLPLGSLEIHDRFTL